MVDNQYIAAFLSIHSKYNLRNIAQKNKTSTSFFKIEISQYIPMMITATVCWRRRSKSINHASEMIDEQWTKSLVLIGVKDQLIRRRRQVKTQLYSTQRSETKTKEKKINAMHPPWRNVSKLTTGFNTWTKVRLTRIF